MSSTARTATGAVAIYADPVAPEVARTVDLIGLRWSAVSTAEELCVGGSRDGTEDWLALIVDCATDATAAWAFLQAVQARLDRPLPALVLVTGAQLPSLRDHRESFDDFCLTPFHPAEFEARLQHLLRRHGLGAETDLVRYGDLALNVETYQATIAGRPLDLTYMEYELLTFLAQHPGKVFTREVLLSRVWGYEYYGGARTVDVHIRRLRAKLGEEHAGLIQTVRSVGYRFGQSRWAG